MFANFGCGKGWLWVTYFLINIFRGIRYKDGEFQCKVLGTMSTWPLFGVFATGPADSHFFSAKSRDEFGQPLVHTSALQAAEIGGSPH
jgi:hypothetical protein